MTHFVGVQADVTARVEAQRARDDALSQVDAVGRSAGPARRLHVADGQFAGADEIVADARRVLVPRSGTLVRDLHLRRQRAGCTRSLSGTSGHATREIAELVRAADAQARARSALRPSPIRRVLAASSARSCRRTTTPRRRGRRRGAGRADERSIRRARRRAASMIVPLRSRRGILGCVAVMTTTVARRSPGGSRRSPGPRRARRADAREHAALRRASARPPRRCSAACCRRAAARSRVWRSRRPTCRPPTRPRSAATGTTCSPACGVRGDSASWSAT